MRRPSAASLVLFGFSLGILGSQIYAATLGSSVFPDVPAGSYYDAAVGEMYAAGIITGYGDGKFGPNDPLTRGQIAVIMKRFRDQVLGISPPMSTSSSSRESVSSSSSSSSSSSLASAGPEGAFRFMSDTFTVDEIRDSLTLSVSRTGGTDGDVTVKYKLNQGTAKSGLDFDATTGTLAFDDGQATKTFSVILKDDEIEEEDEQFTVELFSPSGGAVLGAPSTATIIIADDEGTAAEAAATQTSVNGIMAFSALEYEINDAGGKLTVTVERRTGSTGTVNVNYATSDGTAKNGEHYTSATGTLSFAAGETSKTFEIQVSDNKTINGNKTFTLTLSNPTGGAILYGKTANVIVIDDEVSGYTNGALKFSKESYEASEFDQVAIVIIDRMGGTKGQVTVDYNTINVSAQATSDYTETNGTMTFKEGEGKKELVIPIVRDSIDDVGETFSVKISNPTGGATLASPTQTSVTIN